MTSQPVYEKIILVIMLCLWALSVPAQDAETCAEKLQTAQILFERGQVEKISGLISDCLESGFNREESLQAYKLIIQTYLFNDQHELANSAMLEFIRKNPEYQISPTDHSSFISLFNNYVSKVVIQFSGRTGTNIPFPIISRSNTVLGISGEKKYKTEAFNLFLAAEAKYKLTGKIEINAEIGYSELSFSSSESIPAGVPGIYYAENSIRETQRRIELPLTVTYDVFRVGGLIPYLRLGGGPAFGMISSATGEFLPLDKNNLVRRAGESITLERKFMDFMIQAGAGLKFKVREGFLFTEARLNMGLAERSDFKGYVSANDHASFFYMAGEDRFRLNAINICAGYTRIFFKPVRKDLR